MSEPYQSRLKVPFVRGGEGCGCERCREPLPEPAVQSVDEARRRQAAYRRSRGWSEVGREIPEPTKLEIRPK